MTAKKSNIDKYALPGWEAAVREMDKSCHHIYCKLARTKEIHCFNS